MNSLLLLVLLAAPQECPPIEGIGVRNGHSMFYDVRARRVVLFGGADECRVRNDSWTWNGERWSPVGGSGPTPRTFAAASFDVARGEGILFGGNSVLFGNDDNPPRFLNDMWKWRDGAWSRVDVTGPGPRAEAAMAWDDGERRIVLFGGYRVEPGGERVRLGDTWGWDGASWREIALDGPAARNGTVLVGTPAGVVLFGGSGATGDTWLLERSEWRRLEIPGPPGRFNPVAAYDPTLRGVLRFGGWNGERRTDDVWFLQQSGWRRVEASGPSPRNHAAAALDASRRRIVLFGGHDGEHVFGDTWEWDGERFQLAEPAASRRRVDNGH